MTAAKKFILLTCTAGVFLVGMIISFFMLIEANENEMKAYKSQYESYLLADEMRQVSDDLTRLVRVFTVTRDESFMKQYQAILDIRNGKKARPKNYHKIYWDFVAAGKEKPQPDTVKVSLLELMKQAGFSKEELDMLDEAGKRSAALVKSEIEAVELVRATSPENYDFHEQIAKAQALTHNVQYHKDKAYIMEAVDKFYTLLENRIARQMGEIEKTRSLWQVVVVIFIVIVVAMLGAFALLFASILRQLGEDPGYLYAASKEIGSGNLGFLFRGEGVKKGVYGVFCEMVASMKGKIQEAETKTEEAANESRRAQEATEQARGAQRLAERAKSDGMNAAANSLSEIVERISSASEELSAQIVETNEGAGRQSAMSADAATAMGQMNSTVLEVAKNASSAAENADKAKGEADSGKAVVNQLVEAIKEVYAQTESMKTQLSGLGNRAENIGQIMNVISDIADQTNLLALNAAIEAARAGDAGRGFAVVADEVRKLAEKTMDATKDVAQAISDIQHDTKESIEGMNTAGEAVEHSNALADQAGESLFSILSLVESTADQVRNIATASEEQSAASEEISNSVQNINAISTQTAEGMDQANAAIAELAEMAAELKTLINEMKQD